MLKRKVTSVLVLTLLGAFLFAGPALAQDVYIYPTKGQSQQQQEKDKYECYNWARQQTGFDPTNPQTAQPATPPPAREAPRGGVFRGAGRGAALGAVGT